jgi:hypothetical protein
VTVCHYASAILCLSVVVILHRGAAPEGKLPGAFNRPGFGTRRTFGHDRGFPKEHAKRKSTIYQCLAQTFVCARISNPPEICASYYFLPFLPRDLKSDARVSLQKCNYVKPRDSNRLDLCAFICSRAGYNHSLQKRLDMAAASVSASGGANTPVVDDSTAASLRMSHTLAKNEAGESAASLGVLPDGGMATFPSSINFAILSLLYRQ